MFCSTDVGVNVTMSPESNPAQITHGLVESVARAVIVARIEKDELGWKVKEVSDDKK